MTYAAGTSVSVEKSRAEIETILKRYGASHFAYLSEPERAVIAFRAKDRNIRFDLPLPRRDAFRRPPKQYRERTSAQIDAAHEQACRERWRALVLCIKAKLESVSSKIETFETAFMAHIVMPDGGTVGEHVLPRIAAVYSGEKVPLLPPPSAT
jgi:hypothetical protein